MKDKLTTNVHSEQVAPTDAKPLLPAGRLKERILSVLVNRQGKFSAVDIAGEIGYPIDRFGCLSTCKNVRVILTKLCKEGLLYQWITGNGLSPFSLTNTAKYSVYYLRRDSNLAKTLLEHPNRTLVGYRIR